MLTKCDALCCMGCAHYTGGPISEMKKLCSRNDWFFTEKPPLHPKKWTGPERRH